MVERSTRFSLDNVPATLFVLPDCRLEIVRSLPEDLQAPPQRAEMGLTVIALTDQAMICEMVPVLSENCLAGTPRALRSVKYILDRGGLVSPSL